jgi:mono/diheme cytochrome c family protein
MLFFSLTAALLAAAPNPALLYEQKCLYCHSDELTQHAEFTAEQWVKQVERMRGKAQVFITRADARVLTQFILTTLRLHLTPAPTAKPPTTTQPPTPQPVVAVAEKLPPLLLPQLPPMPPMPPAEESPDDERLDAQGAELISQRCSKCHTLNRVFGKLDSLERSLSTVARMRAKTGSGITHEDAARIERFLRAQFAIDEARAN